MNFKNTIIIMTSNIGARFIQKKASLGFQTTDPARSAGASTTFWARFARRSTRSSSTASTRSSSSALSDDDLRTITRLLVKQLNDNLVDRKIRLELANDVVDWIIEQTCAIVRMEQGRFAGPSSVTSKIPFGGAHPGAPQGGDIEVYLEAVLAYRPADLLAGRRLS